MRWDRKLSYIEGLQFDKIRTFVVLGQIKQYIADYKAAKFYMQQALEAFAKSKISSPFYKAELYEELGCFYAYFGDITQANSTLEQAKNIMNSMCPNHIEYAWVSEASAFVLYYIGKYDDAKLNIEKTLTIRSSRQKGKNYRIAYAKSILGKILCCLHKSDKGITYFKEAEDIYNKIFKSDNPRFVYLYLYMSQAFELQKNYVQAAFYLSKAKDLAIANWDSKASIELAHHLSPIEQFPILDRKDHNIDYYQNTLKLIEQLFGPNYPWVARYNFLLGQCFKNTNKLALAQHYYQTALTIASKHHFHEPVLNEAHQKNIDIIKYHLNALQTNKIH